jgi:hypothetical protein
MLELLHFITIILVLIIIVTSILITIIIHVYSTLSSELNNIQIILHLKEPFPWDFGGVFASNLNPDHAEKASKQGTPVNFNHFP